MNRKDIQEEKSQHTIKSRRFFHEFVSLSLDNLIPRWAFPQNINCIKQQATILSLATHKRLIYFVESFAKWEMCLPDKWQT